MPRLILGIAGRTYHIVGILMLRHIWLWQLLINMLFHKQVKHTFKNKPNNNLTGPANVILELDTATTNLISPKLEKFLLTHFTPWPKWKLLKDINKLLKMVNIKTFIVALKTTWLREIITDNNIPWSIILQSMTNICHHCLEFRDTRYN